MKIDKIILSIIISIIVGVVSGIINPKIFLWSITIIGIISPLGILIFNFRREDIFLSPIFWYFGSLFLWSITVIIDYYLGVEQTFKSNDLWKTAVLYSTANSTSVIAYIFGMKVLKGVNKSSIKTTTLDSNVNILASSMLIILGMLMLVYKVMSIGGFGALGIENRISITQSSSATSSLSLPWQAPLNVGLVSLSLIIKKDNLYKLLLFILCLGLFLIIGFGARGDVLFVCLLSVVVIFYRKGFFVKNRNKLLIIIGILLALSPLFTVSRNMIIYDKSLSEFEDWELAYNRAETGGAFRVTMDVVNYNSVVQWPDNTYLTGLLSFLPSAIYETIIGEPKFSSDKFFASTYYPLRAQTGMSFGFSPVAEAWINGGIISIILVFGIFGLIIACSNFYSLPITILPALMWFQRVSFDNFSSSIIFILFFTVVMKIITFMTTKNTLGISQLSK